MLLLLLSSWWSIGGTGLLLIVLALAAYTFGFSRIAVLLLTAAAACFFSGYLYQQGVAHEKAAVAEAVAVETARQQQIAATTIANLESELMALSMQDADAQTRIATYAAQLAAEPKSSSNACLLGPGDVKAINGGR